MLLGTHTIYTKMRICIATERERPAWRFLRTSRISYSYFAFASTAFQFHHPVAYAKWDIKVIKNRLASVFPLNMVWHRWKVRLRQSWTTSTVLVLRISVDHFCLLLSICHFDLYAKVFLFSFLQINLPLSYSADSFLKFVRSVRMCLPTVCQPQWTNINSAIFRLSKWWNSTNLRQIELILRLNKPMALISAVPMRIWLDRFFDVFDGNAGPKMNQGAHQSARSA